MKLLSEFQYVRFDGVSENISHVKSLRDGYNMLVKDNYEHSKIDSWITKFIPIHNYQYSNGIICPGIVWAKQTYHLADLVYLNSKNKLD